MSLQADSAHTSTARRGIIIGELLIAFLLLAVAVSSLAALMYSVSRRPVTVEETACVGTNASSAACIQKSAGGPSKLLRPGCATRTGGSGQSCLDSLANAGRPNETILRARTDSAAMALLEKKQKASRPADRPDLGFIR